MTDAETVETERSAGTGAPLQRRGADRVRLGFAPGVGRSGRRFHLGPVASITTQQKKQIRRDNPARYLDLPA